MKQYPTIRIIFNMTFYDNAKEENYYDFKSYGKFCTFLNELYYNSESEYSENIVLLEENSSYLSFLNYNVALNYYPEESGYYNGYEPTLYISDNLLNINEVIFDLTPTFYTNTPNSVEIVLFSYQSDYICFHKTGYRYVNTIDKAFTQPINIYSNIENGLGFVSAVSSCKQKIVLSNR